MHKRRDTNNKKIRVHICMQTYKCCCFIMFSIPEWLVDNLLHNSDAEVVMCDIYIYYINIIIVINFYIVI